MSKKLITFVAFVATVFSAQAESLTVADVVLPQNGTASIEIELNNPSSVYNAFTFAVQLPSGLSPVMDGEGYPSFTKGERMGNKNPQSGFISESNQIRLALVTDGTAISGTSGLLLAPVIQLSETVPVNTEFTVRLVDITFTTTSLTKEYLPDVEFKVIVGEPDDGRTVLDENSTVAPEASDGAVNVRVLRTIKANQWSTICLPFAMTEEQVQEAFVTEENGTVQLAKFSDWNSEEDGEDVVGVNIIFETVNGGIEKNNPLLIKVSSPVTEFAVDGVTIEPVEEPSVVIKHGSKKNDPKSYMIGTYQAETVLESCFLFLSGNKFWYSTGATKMKGYRAYFDFTDKIESGLSSRVTMLLDDEVSTGIATLHHNQDTDNEFYNLQGQRVSKPSKGVFIQGSRKVIRD